MSVRRRKIMVSPNHSCAYSPHAQARQSKVDALTGAVILRLQALDCVGGLIREMHLELSPECASALGLELLDKAKKSEGLAN